MKDGERNTKLYHSVVKRREASGAISELYDMDGKCLNKQEEIEQKAVQYYDNLYNKDFLNNDRLNLKWRRKVSQEENDRLCASVEEEEIKKAVWAIGANKAPGPYGFNAFFYQQCWDTIKQELVTAIKWLMNGGAMVRQVNHAFLVLIPKKKVTTSLTDFRPIACCTVLYKIFSKILACRLKNVLPSLVSENQGAFVPGRNIAACALLASEFLLDFNTQRGTQKACVKLDISKAYDSVQWDTLWWILQEVGFAQEWIRLVKECVSTTSFSVLVNGASAGMFRGGNGLRQGDPLSPLLFTLVMECLTLLMDEAENKMEFKTFTVKGTMVMSHIIFADDVLIFALENNKNLLKLMEVLHVFGELTGLMVNKQKTNIYFSSACGDTETILSDVNIEEAELPTRYLGFPLAGGNLKCAHFEPCLDQLQEMLE